MFSLQGFHFRQLGSIEHYNSIYEDDPFRIRLRPQQVSSFFLKKKKNPNCLVTSERGREEVEETYIKEELKAELVVGRESLEAESWASKRVIEERKPIKHLGVEDLGLKVDDNEAAGPGIESLEREAMGDQRERLCASQTDRQRQQSREGVGWRGKAYGRSFGVPPTPILLIIIIIFRCYSSIRY